MRWMLLVTMACSATPTEPTEPPVWTRDPDRVLPDPWREAPCMDVELADLDGDGDLDVVLALEGPANILLENDGGSFTHREAGFVDRTDSEHAQAADLDGDGRTDLFFANEDLGGADELYLSTGPWTWQDASDTLGEAITSNAAHAVDLDGDGLAEIVRGHAGASVIWSVPAAAAWPDTPEDEAITQDIASGDLDGDGDLDLVFGNEGADAIWLQEDGRFTAAATLPMDGETRAVDLGDVDGDGIVDLVAARVGWRMTDPQSRLYRGLGDGRFAWVEGGLPAESFNTLDLDLVDLDGDGDLDLLGAHIDAAGEGPWTAWRNVGGTFEDATAELLPGQPMGQAIDIDVGDLDGDGVIDLYLCDRTGRDRVLFGRPP